MPLNATIGAIPGYPEDGANSWRASNDRIFIEAVNNFNWLYAPLPSNPLHWSPTELKAQAMVESGGGKFKSAFLTDPLQVNNSADWIPGKSKIGLTQGEAMTPSLSASKALLWLKVKMEIHDKTGAVVGYRSKFDTWKNYNGNDETNRKGHEYHKGMMHKIWYAGEVTRLAGDN